MKRTIEILLRLVAPPARLIALLFAVVTATGTVLAAAPVPTVMWDGDFSSLSKTVGGVTYSINNTSSGNSVATDHSYIKVADSDADYAAPTITASGGDAPFGTADGSTVIAFYREMPITTDNNRAVLSLLSPDTYNNGHTHVGVCRLMTNGGGKTAGSFSRDGAWFNNSPITANVFSGGEQMIALTYKSTSMSYYVNGRKIATANPGRTFKPTGVCLGGVDYTSSSKFYAMKNMKILGVAIFDRELTETEINEFAFSGWDANNKWRYNDTLAYRGNTGETDFAYATYAIVNAAGVADTATFKCKNSAHHNYYSWVKGDQYYAYPGIALFFDQSNCNATANAGFSDMTIGGLNVTAARVTGETPEYYKISSSSSNRQTFFGDPSGIRESYFNFSQSFEVQREDNNVSRYTLLYGRLNFNIEAGQYFKLNTTCTKGATNAVLTAGNVDTTAPCLKMSGGGQFHVKQLDASTGCLDYSALDIATQSTTPFIKGNLKVSDATTYKFPIMSGGASFRVAEAVTEDATRISTFAIGDKEYSAPLTFNASSGTADFPAVATVAEGSLEMEHAVFWPGNIQFTENITWDAKPSTVNASTTPVVINVDDDTLLAAMAPISIKSLTFNIAAGKTLALYAAGAITTVEGVTVTGGGTLKLASDSITTINGPMTIANDVTLGYSADTDSLTVNGTLTVASGKTLTLAPVTISETTATLVTATTLTVNGTLAVAAPDSDNTYTLDTATTANSVILKRTPNPAFSYYNSISGGAPSGWGISSWSSDTTVDNLRVGPSATMPIVREITTSFHPGNAVTLGGKSFSFSVYADVSKINVVTDKNYVLASIGRGQGDGGNKFVALYRRNNKIMLGNLVNGNWNIGPISVDVPSGGFHLYTAVCGSDGTLALYRDAGTGSGELATRDPGNALSIAASPNAGLQLGNIWGGNDSFLNGTGIALAAAIGFNKPLTAAEVANLAESFPATDGTAIYGDIDNKTSNSATAGSAITVYSGSAAGNQYLGISSGTLTVPADNTVSVPHVRVQNATTGSTTVNIRGTVNVTSTSDDPNLAWKQSGTADYLNYKGVLLGNVATSGTGAFNVYGTLDASGTYVQMVNRSTGSQTLTIDSGTLKTKCFYSDKADKATVVLQNNGTLEISATTDRGQTIAYNLGHGTLKILNGLTLSTDNKMSIVCSATLAQPTTIDPYGNNSTISIASGTGYVTVADSSTGTKGVVTFLGTGGNVLLTDANYSLIDVSGYTGSVTCQGTTANALAKLSGFAGTVYFTSTVDASSVNLSGATVNVADGCTYTATARQEGTMVLGAGATATLKVTDDIFNYEGYIPVVSGSGSVGYYRTSTGAAVVNTVTETYTIGNNLLPYYYVWETTEGGSAGIASGASSGWGRMDGRTRPVNGKNVAFHVQGETTVNLDEANVSYATIQAYGTGTLKFSGANALTVATQFVVEEGVTLEYDTTKLTVSSIEVDDGAELAVVGGTEVVVGGTEVSPAAITADIAGEGTLRIASGVVSLNHVNSSFTGGVYIMPGARAVSTAATDNTATGFGRQGTTITVYVGGQLDVAGTSGVSHNLVIDTDPAGGEGDYEAAIVNTGTNIGKTERQACSLTVNTSATIDCSHTWGILASSHGATTLTLAKDVTLTKTGTGTFLIASATIHNTGSGVTNPGIDIAEGTVEIVSQGSSTDCTLASGATLDVMIRDNATMNVYKRFAASNLGVSGNGTVNVSSSGSLILSAAYGAGTINWTGKQPDGDVWKTSADWTGTNVVMSSGTTEITGLRPDNWGRQRSFIVMKNLKGYLGDNDNAEVTAKTILENGANGYALNVSNGYRVKWYFREISGDGDILETHQLSSGSTGGSQQFIFKDASEFAGNICIDSTSSGNHHTKRYTFSSAKYDTASESTTYGVIKVLDDGSATIGDGKEWKVDHGITIAGTVTLLGSATMSSSVTISGTTAKLLLADTALTINNTLTFANGAELTIDPGDIDLTTTATLITGLTNTEAPDISGITVPGCTVSVGGTSGAYTIDAVYKDTSWRGESATWSESSFNGKASATDGQDVMFMAGANGTVTVTLDGTRTPANVVFNGSSTTTYTLTGGTFSPSETVTIESGSVAIESAATGTYVVNTGATLSLTNATVTSVSGAGTLNIPAGGVVTLESATALDSLSYITGEGELHVGANIPATTLNALLKKSYTVNGDTAYYWHGTVVIEDFVQTDDSAVGGTTLDCGNASSTIRLKNSTIRYFSSNASTAAAVEIVGTVKTLNGGSSTIASFGPLKGSGKFVSEDNNTVTHLYRFASSPDFAGSLSINGRRFVFGSEGEANNDTDKSTYKGTIRVSSGAVAALGENASWVAYYGIYINGTLIVNGSNGYITSNPQQRNVVFANGATVQFNALSAIKIGSEGQLAPTVASGSTVNITFGEGVTPVAGTKLISWGGAPEGSFVAEDCTLVKKSDGLYISGGVDDGTAVVEDTEGVVTIPSGATAVSLAITGGSASLVSTTALVVNGGGKNVTVYATDANGQMTSIDISSAFKVTPGENNTYTIELNEEVVQKNVTPTTFAEDGTPTLSMPAIPGLWYKVLAAESISNGTLVSPAGGTAVQATTTTVSPAAPAFSGTVKYYKIAVGASKAALQ